MKHVHTVAASVMAMSLVLAAGVASAQTVPGEGTAATNATPTATESQVVVTWVNGQRVYRHPSLILTGEIHRPYNFAVTGRTAPGYRYAETAPRFVQEIVGATRRAPL